MQRTPLRHPADARPPSARARAPPVRRRAWRHSADGPPARKLSIIADQKFPAPDCAVGAESGAVEGHADDRFIQSMLGHAAGHVGMMMLDRNAGEFPRRPAGHIASRHNPGCKIVGDTSRAEIANSSSYSAISRSKALKPRNDRGRPGDGSGSPADRCPGRMSPSAGRRPPGSEPHIRSEARSAAAHIRAIGGSAIRFRRSRASPNHRSARESADRGQETDRRSRADARQHPPPR